MNTISITRKDKGEHLLVGTDVVTIRASGDQTSGKVLMMEVTVPSGGGPPALHRHPSAEIFHILEGDFEVSTADHACRVSTVTLAAGDTLSVPSMVWHNFKNIGQTAGRLFAIHSPAAIEKFARELGVSLESPHAPFPSHDPPLEAQQQEIMQKIQKYMEILPNDQLVRE